MKDLAGYQSDHEIIADKMRVVPFFRNCDDDAIKRLSENAVKHQYNKGKLLFVHEDTASRYYLICSGWVKTFRETLDGTQAVMDILNAGHVVGETAIFNDDLYSFSAELVENAEVISFPLSDLQNEVETNPKLAMDMLKALAQRNIKQDREMEHLAIQNAPQRIGCFILRLVYNQEQEGPINVHLPYDKTLIAARLGMQPETFSRALGKLKKETGLEVKGATVSLDSIQQLSCYSCAMCSSEFPCHDLKKMQES